jgi:hypothetical protein
MIPFLKIAVVVMGILIVGGLAVIGVKIYQDSIKVVETFGEEPMEAVETVEVAEAAPVPSPEPQTQMQVVTTTAIAPYTAAVEHLDLGRGARVQSMIAEGHRLILNVRTASGIERVVIINMNSGTVLGDIALEAPR